METLTRPKPKTRKELYEAQYEASKRGGKPFFPDTLAHDALVALVVAAIIFILAIVLPASSAGPANPTGTAYSPRPEWYFAFLQQWLRFFPGAIEPLGAIVIPTIVLIIVLALPFFNRGLNRSFSRRKLSVGIGGVVVLGVLIMEVTGILFPPTLAVPGVPTSPTGATYGQLAEVGATAYANSCASCHGAKGEGVVAPPLIGGKASLAKYGSAKGLLDFISTNMPVGAPGSLSRQAYVDILSYLLVQNSDVSSDTIFDQSRLINIKLK